MEAWAYCKCYSWSFQWDALWWPTCRPLQRNNSPWSTRFAKICFDATPSCWRQLLALITRVETVNSFSGTLIMQALESIVMFMMYKCLIKSMINQAKWKTYGMKFLSNTHQLMQEPLDLQTWSALGIKGMNWRPRKMFRSQCLQTTRHRQKGTNVFKNLSLLLKLTSNWRSDPLTKLEESN